MIGLLCFLLAVLALPFKLKLGLEAENAVLRHQLNVLRRKLHGRVRLANHDRWFFIQLYRWFPSILKVLTIIRPETLVRWHGAGFRCYWRWKSRPPAGRGTRCGSKSRGAGRGADLARVARRLSGELTEDGFKPLRPMNGIYLQLHAYVLRIAVPYGTPSSAQLHTLARIARKYDRKYAHFTTRLGRSTSRSPRSAIDRRRQAFGQAARLKNPSPFGAPPHISGCSRSEVAEHFSHMGEVFPREKNDALLDQRI
jgi:hypothetical protein